MTSNKKTWIWIGALLVVLIGVSMATTSDTPREYPPYTLDSPSPTGLKAFYTYAEDTFDNVEIARPGSQTLEQETSVQDQLVIMADPPFPEDETDEQRYRTYVESGRTVLLLKEDPDGMFGVETKRVKSDSTGDVKDQAQNTYETKAPPPVRLQKEDEDTVLLKDDEGPLAIKRSVGDGTLIVANMPVWLTNDEILKSDHLPLVNTLLDEASRDSDRLVFFKSEGQGAVQSLLSVFPNWLLVLTGMAILWGILWLLHQGKRFGWVATPPRAAVVRFSDERMTALAAWYLRAGLYKDALRIQADYLKLLLQEKWGIAYRRSWQDSSSQLAKRLDQWNEEEMASFAARLEAVLHQETVSKQAFLAWTKEIDKVKKEVEAR